MKMKLIPVKNRPDFPSETFHLSEAILRGRSSSSFIDEETVSTSMFPLSISRMASIALCSFAFLLNEYKNSDQPHNEKGRFLPISETVSENGNEKEKRIE